MQPLEDREILIHLLDKYPEEACGIIQNKKGKLNWIPCENLAEDKETDFILDQAEYLKASLTGDIHAIVHSHPNASSELSERDKKAKPESKTRMQRRPTTTNDGRCATYAY